MTKKRRTKKTRRVVFVVNEAFFFVSHRLHLAKGLIKAGYEVHVAAPASHDWAPADFSVKELQRHGCVFHPIRLSRRGENPLAEITAAIDMARLFRRLQPTVAHLLTIKPILYGGIVARLSRTPLVVCGFTGLGQIFVDKSLWGFIRRHVVSQLLRWSVGNRNAIAIAQNSDDHGTIAKIVPAARGRIVTILGSGVDLEEFSYRSLPDGPPIVLFAARLLWEKGVGVFVEAARSLKNQGSRARFVIVGSTVETNPRSVPRSVLDGWVEEGVIEWWGYRSDMPEVLAGCTVFCLPTIYGEGLPKVLLEAAAVGRPIVTTDIGGCRDVVVGGRNGFLCPKSDANAVSACVEALVADHETCKKMGREGRRMAEERFAVAGVVDQTLAAYARYLPSTCDPPFRSKGPR